MTITIGVAQAWFAIGFVSGMAFLLIVALIWGSTDTDEEDPDASSGTLT